MNLRIDGRADLVLAELAEVYPVTPVRFAEETGAVYHQYGWQRVHISVGDGAVEEYESAVRVRYADYERVQLLDGRVREWKNPQRLAAHHGRIAGNLRVTQHAHEYEVDVCVAAGSVLYRFSHFAAVKSVLSVP